MIEKQNVDAIPVFCDEKPDHEEEGRKRVWASLKTDINSFLCVRLPNKTTLEEMEKISVRVFDEIASFWEGKGWPDS